MPLPLGYPQPLEELIGQLRRLPGIGARTAERLALALLEWPEADAQAFAQMLATLHARLHPCQQCGNLADAPLCRICADPRRQPALVCVVETAAQIPVIERCGSFRGLYHVLGGRLAPLDRRGPEQLRLGELRQRLASGAIRELILATSSDVEGEATAAYLAMEFKRPGLVISRIAAGVPVGADLGFADPATIAIALSARRTLE